MTAIAHGQWTISSDRSISDLFLSLFDNGQWLMLLAALSMAVGTVMVRYVCRHADPVTATGWHMILGGLPLFALSNQLESAQWVDLTTANWMALAYSTIFGSAIAYGLFFYFASSGSLTSLSSLTFLTPVFALLFGNLFLSEVLSQVQWFGVCLTLVSIYLINQREVLSQRFKRLTFDGVSPDQEDEIQNRSVIPQSPLEISEIAIGSLPIVESESE